MVAKQFAGGCWHGLGLGIVCLESEFFQDAVNQVRLHQVDCATLMVLDVDA